VALARALCGAPGLLLLDEPLASLDAGTRIDVRAELQRQLKEFTGPTLLVTHDPLEALSLADRIVVLEGGRVVQDASPSEVVRRPATPYVARLAGLNLLRGNATAGVLDLDEGGLLVTTESGLSGPALAVVRPSAVLVQRHAPESASARNVFDCQIATMEVLGDRVRLGLTGPPTLFADITTGAVADLRLVPGEQVWVSLKATEVEAYATAVVSGR
jgi:molybdate transport system ATP-binding protein